MFVILFAVLVSALLLVISLFHYLHRPTHMEGFDYLKYVALGAVALEGPLVGLKAFLSLRKKVRLLLYQKIPCPQHLESLVQLHLLLQSVQGHIQWRYNDAMRMQ